LKLLEKKKRARKKSGEEKYEIKNFQRKKEKSLQRKESATWKT